MIAIDDRIKDYHRRLARAWAPPPKLKPSEWAEQYRYLNGSAIPGPYRNDNAPYLRGIMDIPTAAGVEQINVMKAAQVGVSEALRCILGYWADHEPDPTGLALPTRPAGRKISKTDVQPLFNQVDRLRSLKSPRSRDFQLERIILQNGFRLDLMWSGSVSSTASNPYRRVVNDEVDKFEDWAGDEPDPVGRTWKRTRSYGNRRLQINVSTPSTTAGKIFQLYDRSSVKLFFWVPCPHCGEWQILRWPQLKWPKYSAAPDKRELADMVVAKQSAYYECEHCAEAIYETDKREMVRQGVWSNEQDELVDAWAEIYHDAEEIEEWPEGTRIGFQISALYCLWETWSSLAAEFLRAEGDVARSFNFRTETLGLPFEFQVSRAPKTIFSEKAQRAKLPEGIVPAWAWMVLATVDTQVDSFYAVIRAWGSGQKSARVWHGEVNTFDDLDRLLFQQQWPSENKDYPAMKPQLTLIDSGGTADDVLGITRTMQVYEWVVPRQPYVFAIKGSSRRGPGLYWPMKEGIGKGRRKAPDDLRGWMVDSEQAQDLLGEMIKAGIDTETEKWMLNKRADETYESHMAALHKTAERRGSKVVETWKPVHSGGRHDYRDCEAYQIVAAYMQRVHLLPPETELLEQRQREIEAAKAKPKHREVERSEESWNPRPL